MIFVKNIKGTLFLSKQEKGGPGPIRKRCKYLQSILDIAPQFRSSTSISLSSNSAASRFCLAIKTFKDSPPLSAVRRASIVCSWADRSVGRNAICVYNRRNNSMAERGCTRQTGTYYVRINIVDGVYAEEINKVLWMNVRSDPEYDNILII